MDKREADAFIRRVSWLAETPAEFQDQLLAKCDLIRSKKGDLVYEADEDAATLYGLVKGHVEVHVPALGVDATLSYIGGPGYWFGDSSLTKEKRRVAIVARTDCELLRVPLAEIMRITAREQIAWRYFMQLMSRNYTLAVSVVFALKQGDPVKRVAAMLLVLHGHDATAKDAIAASQFDLAEMAHLGRSKVNASLRKLETLGQIRRRYGLIEVIDARALRDFVLGGERTMLLERSPGTLGPIGRRDGARPNS